MKKVVRIIFLLLLLIAAWAAWNIFGPVIKKPEDKYLFIKTGASYSDVLNDLTTQGVLNNTFFFNLISKQVNYPKQVKAGRYDLSKVSNVLSLVRMLKAGNQSPVHLIINKIRTKEDLAGKLGKNFEFDSAQAIRFLTSNDSLATFGCDTNTVMTNIIPNTYELKWNGGFKRLFTRFVDERKIFWNKERLDKAASKKLSPVQIYTMASIVEEESNDAEDRKLIASVYLNRMKKNMRLQADPTVKYAMRNFGLKRILFGHLKYDSPFNTYQVTGLPPGPICTPSTKALDAVLDAPETDYIFFAAKPSFNGQHNFAATYEQHKIFAKQYQQALDSLIITRSNSK